LYPDAANLLVMERKYGDSLGFEDLNGFRQRKKKKRAAKAQDDNRS